MTPETKRFASVMSELIGPAVKTREVMGVGEDSSAVIGIECRWTVQMPAGGPWYVAHSIPAADMQSAPVDYVAQLAARNLLKFVTDHLRALESGLKQCPLYVREQRDRKSMTGATEP